MTTLSDSVRIKSAASAISERLDEAFSFTTSVSPEDSRCGAEIWTGLAAQLISQPVRLHDLDAVQQHTIRSFPNTEFRLDPDGHDLIVGSIVTRNATDHAVAVEGMGSAWTWCFFDALLLVPTFGRSVRISSHCARSATDFSVDVGPDGCSAPEGLTVTLPVQFQGGSDLRRDFCCRSRGWLSDPEPQEGVVLLPVEDALAVTSRVAEELGLSRAHT